jgi:hypothetical protein
VWADASYNIVRWIEMPRGGHFAMMEEPVLLAAEVRAHFAGLPGMAVVMVPPAVVPPEAVELSTTRVDL